MIVLPSCLRHKFKLLFKCCVFKVRQYIKRYLIAYRRRPTKAQTNMCIRTVSLDTLLLKAHDVPIRMRGHARPHTRTHAQEERERGRERERVEKKREREGEAKWFNGLSFREHI